MYVHWHPALLSIALRYKYIIKEPIKWHSRSRNGGSVSPGMVAQSWPDCCLNWVRNTQSMEHCLFLGSLLHQPLGCRILFVLLPLQSANTYGHGSLVRYPVSNLDMLHMKPGPYDVVTEFLDIPCSIPLASAMQRIFLI